MSNSERETAGVRRVTPSLFKVPCSTLIVLLLVQASLFAQLPATQLNAIFPPGGRAGSQVEVTITGADLDEVSRLLFSHPGITATRNEPPDDGTPAGRTNSKRFIIAIEPTVPTGFYEARAVGRFGISNPRAIEVGNSAEFVAGAEIHEFEKAMPVAVGQVVNGRIAPKRPDFFRIALSKGQRVFFACRARSIDSRLAPILTVSSAQGRELARTQGSADSDSMLDFTAPENDDFVLRLSDFLHDGGTDHYYRLAIDDGPHMDYVFPPAGVAGSNDRYTLYGRKLPGGRPVPGLEIDGSPLEQVSVNVPLPNDEAATVPSLAGDASPSRSVLDAIGYRWNAANPVNIYFARAPVVREQEPNDRSSSPTRISVPCEAVGQFYPARDRDWFEFEARKGDVFFIEVISHRMGRDVDAVLVLQKITRSEAGAEIVRQLTQADDPGDRNSRVGSDFDTSTDDPSYRFAADEDATYRIQLWNQFGGTRNDPRDVYRLVIRPPRPDFRFSAVARRITTPNNNNLVLDGVASIRRGGTAVFDLHIDRREGSAGEIEIAVTGLPAGVSTSGITVASQARTATLILSAAEDAPPWAGTIQIVGRSLTDKDAPLRLARGGTVARGTRDRRQQPPRFRTTRDIALAVVDREVAPASITTDSSELWETSRGGKLEIPIKVQRRDGFQSDLTLVATGLPNELKPANMTIKGDAADGKLALNITKGNAKSGNYTFYLRADARYKRSRNPDAIAAAEKLVLEIKNNIEQSNNALKLARESETTANRFAQEAARMANEAEQAKAAAADVVEKANGAVSAARDALATLRERTDQVAVSRELQDAEQAAVTAVTKQTESNNKLKTAAENLTRAQEAARTAERKKKEAAAAVAKAEEAAKGAETRKQPAEKELAETKKFHAPKDTNFVVISTPIRVRVVETPLQWTEVPDIVTIAPEGQVEIPVSLTRNYGFDGDVQLTIELPKGVSGLQAGKTTLAAQQSQTAVPVSATKPTPTGEHEAILRARAKFNNIDVQATKTIVLRFTEP